MVQLAHLDSSLLHPGTRNTGAHRHPKLRKSGAIWEPWHRGPRYEMNG